MLGKSFIGLETGSGCVCIGSVTCVGADDSATNSQFCGGWSIFTGECLTGEGSSSTFGKASNLPSRLGS